MRIIKKEAIRLSYHGQLLKRQIFEQFKFVKGKEAWKASLKKGVRLSYHGQLLKRQIFEKFKFVKGKEAWKASLKKGVNCKLPTADAWVSYICCRHVLISYTCALF